MTTSKRPLIMKGLQACDMWSACIWIHQSVWGIFGYYATKSSYSQELHNIEAMSEVTVIINANKMLLILGYIKTISHQRIDRIVTLYAPLPYTSGSQRLPSNTLGKITPCDDVQAHRHIRVMNQNNDRLVMSSSLQMTISCGGLARGRKRERGFWSTAQLSCSPPAIAALNY